MKKNNAFLAALFLLTAPLAHAADPMDRFSRELADELACWTSEDAAPVETFDSNAAEAPAPRKRTVARLFRTNVLVGGVGAIHLGVLELEVKPYIELRFQRK
jgi:hypothetical protein